MLCLHHTNIYTFIYTNFVYSVLITVVIESPAKRIKLESCDIIDRSSTSSDDSWRGYETGTKHLFRLDFVNFH